LNRQHQRQSKQDDDNSPVRDVVPRLIGELQKATPTDEQAQAADDLIQALRACVK
jgi:hypothetical protein